MRHEQPSLEHVGGKTGYERMGLDKMTRVEAIVVGLVLGSLCPLLLFVFGWWGAATLSRYLLPIPESVIAAMALAGLALGLLLDGLYLRRWIPRFYRVGARVMVPVYLCCSVMAVAFFMGLPLGNLVLGTLAGGYIGRREYHAARSRDSAARTIRKASLFTAGVTGAEALPIGLLALNEDWVVDWLQAVTHIDAWTIPGLLGIGLIVSLCGVLMAVQFWCTKTMAWIVFGPGGREGGGGQR